MSGTPALCRRAQEDLAFWIEVRVNVVKWKHQRAMCLVVSGLANVLWQAAAKLE